MKAKYYKTDLEMIPDNKIGMIYKRIEKLFFDNNNLVHESLQKYGKVTDKYLPNYYKKERYGKQLKRIKLMYFYYPNF